MQVIATRQGYYADGLREKGEVFEMDDDIYQPKASDGKTPMLRDGKPATCKWVRPVGAKDVVNIPAPTPDRPPGAGPKPGSIPDKAAPQAPAATEAL